MIGLLMALAAGAATWEPMELASFKAPVTMFFCNSDLPEQGVASVFLRHDPQKSVMDFGRFLDNSEDAKFKGAVQSVSIMKLDGAHTDIKLTTAAPQQNAELIVHLGISPTKADLSWESSGSTYAASCTSVPVPPGRTE